MSVTDFRIGAGSVMIDDDDVGMTTEEGVVISYEPDIHLHLSGQFGTTPVKASLVGQKLTIEMWLAEHTMDNIELTYAGIVNSQDKLQFGGVAGRAILGHTLVITPFDGTPAWSFANAVPISAVDANFKVNDERIMHVTFQALVAEAAAEDENIGYIMS
jgi:hypothetical protein